MGSLSPSAPSTGGGARAASAVDSETASATEAKLSTISDEVYELLRWRPDGEMNNLARLVSCDLALTAMNRMSDETQEKGPSRCCRIVPTR